MLQGVPALAPLGPARFLEREHLPSQARSSQSQRRDFDADAYDAERAARYARREGFY